MKPIKQMITDALQIRPRTRSEMISLLAKKGVQLTPAEALIDRMCNDGRLKKTYNKAMDFYLYSLPGDPRARPQTKTRTEIVD